MFVYQTSTARGFEPTQAKVDSFFRCPERWRRQGESYSFTVLLAALIFGGVAKIASFVPLTALAATVLTLAWVLGDDNSRGEAKWIHQLTLGVTGLFYLGLGYCCGALALTALPAGLAVHHWRR